VTDAADSRRELLRRGAIASAALVATGALRPALAGAQSTTDEDLRDFLNQAIALEQVTVLAYARAADAAEAGDRQELEDFRGQEQAHANALRSAIDELGFDPPEPPDSPTDTGVFDDVEGLDEHAVERLTGLLGDLEGAKTPAEYRNLLITLEGEQVRLYLDGAPPLDSADLATTAAEIAGCQAQHLYVLNLDGATPSEAIDVVTEAINSNAEPL
jgi:rubrerythrin